jgi:hypothetical protein
MAGSRGTYNDPMSARMLFTAPLLAALAAAVPPASGAPREAAPRAAEAAASGPAGTAEPNVQRTVIDDGGTRVEELRVRGQLRRVTVTPRNGGKPYEIIPADGARDLAPGPGSTRGAAGQRVWNVLDF